MSAEPTLVTAAHFRYLAERTAGDDAFLRDLLAAAQAAGLPAIQISPTQASFMQILLRLAKARAVVEVGTLAGYSAIWMARALPPGGTVRTIEIDEGHADFAESWIARSDVADRVEVLRGAGADVLGRMPDDSADAAFLDADKRGYPAYLEACLRVVRPGGLVMFDNAFAFGELLSEAPTDPETPAVRAFNEVMARETRLHGVIVPLGDGLWVGVRLA
jgi:predicted O-methyltransferase YrrM